MLPPPPALHCPSRALLPCGQTCPQPSASLPSEAFNTCIATERCFTVEPRCLRNGSASRMTRREWVGDNAEVWRPRTHGMRATQGESDVQASRVRVSGAAPQQQTGTGGAPRWSFAIAASLRALLFTGRARPCGRASSASPCAPAHLPKTKKRSKYLVFPVFSESMWACRSSLGVCKGEASRQSGGVQGTGHDCSGSAARG